MGKNAKQIVTFKDLNDVGYRLPRYSYTDETECVTYGDLKNISSSKSELTDSNYQSMTNISNFDSIAADSYVDTKCVTWEELKALNAYIPIRCYIEEDVTLSTQANAITFTLFYKTKNTSTYTEYDLGTCQVSPGAISGSAYKDFWVPIVELADGYDTWVMVCCGNTSKNQAWKYKIKKGRVDTGWITIGSGSNDRTEACIGIGQENLDGIAQLQEITTIGFYVT